MDWGLGLVADLLSEGLGGELDGCLYNPTKVPRWKSALVL